MARLLPTTLGRLPVIDGVLALALCVLAVGGLLTGQVQERPWAVTIPVAVVSTLAIALRTRYPIALAALVSALAVVQALLAGGISSTLWALVVLAAISQVDAEVAAQASAVMQRHGRDGPGSEEQV